MPFSTRTSFDEEANSLRVIRNGTLLVTNDRIAGLWEGGEEPKATPDSEIIDASGEIITPGFIDAHRHNWQTFFNRMGSNTTLVDYYSRYANSLESSLINVEDIYNSQLAGMLENLNAGVTTTLDYAHHTWSDEIAEDISSLGVDTQWTFSVDILTQARLWLQRTRVVLYENVLDTWHIPVTNPMSVNQALLLATRNGGLALRKPDLGVIRDGAKADLIIWNGKIPSMLGWVDPVAAAILHASIGDIQHVLVNGNFVKRNRTLTAENYSDIQARFINARHTHRRCSGR